jgi:hypothetical protein
MFYKFKARNDIEKQNRSKRNKNKKNPATFATGFLTINQPNYFLGLTFTIFPPFSYL